VKSTKGEKLPSFKVRKIKMRVKIKNGERKID